MIEIGLYRHYKNKLYYVLGVGFKSNPLLNVNHETFNLIRNTRYCFFGRVVDAITLQRYHLYRMKSNTRKFLITNDTGMLETSKDMETFVVYKSMYNDEKFGNEALWVRPLEEFTNNVEIETIDEVISIPRFTKV